MLGTVMQDVRFAMRTLRKQPMFTLVATVTLALGIGANTAVFSVVNGVLLSPLPYPSPDRLVAVWPRHFASNGEIAYLQEHAHSYDGGAAAFSPGWGMVLSRPNEAVQLAGARTSANFFRVLGARPALGRTFTDDESRPGSDRVAVLSHELWTQRFSADPRVIGQTITIDGVPCEVIGVMTPNFNLFQANADLWLPLVMDQSASFYKTGGTAFLLGRLRAGATPASAASELATLVPAMRDALGFEAAYGREASVIPLHDAVVAQLRQTLLILLCAVGFILLIAGANVGNLQLSRAAGRRHEIAIRAALGAARGRIIRQLLSESVLLAMGGGALGIGFGALGVRWLRHLLPADTPRLESISLDLRVLAVCALATLGVGIIFGLAPALVASRTDLEGTLRAARSGHGAGAAGRRTRGSLVVAETALALVLVIAAGLMIQTLWRLSLVDAGFRATNILTMRVQPTSDAYGSREQRALYFEQVLERVRGERGVLTVGAIQHLPLSGFDWHKEVEIEGRLLAPGETPFRPGYRTILGDYFQTMGIPLLAGRAFSPSDAATSPAVMIVSAAFARRAFGGESAVGRRIRAGNATRAQWATIVGEVGNVRHTALTAEPQPEFYLSASQFPQGAMAIVVRTAGDPMLSVRQLHERIATLDRGVPISDVRTIEDLVSASVQQPRVIMLLMLAFAGVGLALGAIGIYGVVSYGVSQRVREIGIRIALGAPRATLIRAVVRDGLILAGAGVAIGMVAALVLTRGMATLVFGVSASDPATYVALSLLLVGIAATASYIPARRAARVDPVIALRGE